MPFLENTKPLLKESIDGALKGLSKGLNKDGLVGGVTGLGGGLSSGLVTAVQRIFAKSLIRFSKGKQIIVTFNSNTVEHIFSGQKKSNIS